MSALRVGDLVHYSPIIGGPHNGLVYVVTALEMLDSGHSVAWLNGKAGCVAASALSKTTISASRLALAERVREACAEAAREHSCMTYSELCDCGGKIAKDIRALDLSKLVEGE